MLSYIPLWETMKKKGISTYTLQYKGNIGGGTIQRLQKNETVSSNTLDMLCNILACPIQEIVVHIPDESFAPLFMSTK